MKNIPYSRQSINDDDIQAVIDVLKSDFITCGPAICEFEKAVASYCNANDAIALSSGTAALHVLMKALEVGSGDIIWTSPISFVASSNCALYLGADVDFVDIDPLTANISIDELEQKLVKAKSENKLPKVLITVHFSGRPCNMKKISKLADEYGFMVVEDGAHAFGGHYDKKPIGSCKYSIATMFSFHPVKSMTTGEGGIIVTNDENLASKIHILRTHGITRNPDIMENTPHGPWYYEMLELGYNYRITDIQAALGLSQIKRIDKFIGNRNRLAKRYAEILEDLPLILPPADDNSAWHIYVAQLDNSKTDIPRKEVFEKLVKAGIGANVHYIPIHTQPYYQKLGFNIGDFPAAEDFYFNAISIPLFPDLTDDEQDYIAAKLTNILV